MATATLTAGSLVSRPSLVEAFLGWLTSLNAPQQDDAVSGDYAVYHAMCRGL